MINQDDCLRSGQRPGLPAWVPTDVRDYLAHTGAGRSIRDLARDSACHASTILRRIRKVEQRRDDPLIDAALTRIETWMAPRDRGQARCHERDYRMMTDQSQTQQSPLPEKFEKDAMRILRRLCETGAVLAVARDMDMAVVVREGADGSSTRTAVLAQDVAEAMALTGWIETAGKGRILRYVITGAGREALRARLGDAGVPAPAETADGPAMQVQPAGAVAATGMAEAPARFAPPDRVWGERTVRDEVTGQARKVRYNLADSPLAALARRRDKSGAPFLDEGLVRCGERLREDFELAQMEPGLAQNWDHFLTAGTGAGPAQGGGGRGPDAARARVVAALSDLGPGLSDVALRCCCYLEGLESAEQRLGWSARSGKIVLRIALQRLKRHYAETLTADAQMIG